MSHSAKRRFDEMIFDQMSWIHLSRRIPDLRVGNNIDEIDKKLIPASIHPWGYAKPEEILEYIHNKKFKGYIDWYFQIAIEEKIACLCLSYTCL